MHVSVDRSIRHSELEGTGVVILLDVGFGAHKITGDKITSAT